MMAHLTSARGEITRILVAIGCLSTGGAWFYGQALWYLIALTAISCISSVVATAVTEALIDGQTRYTSAAYEHIIANAHHYHYRTYNMSLFISVVCYVGLLVDQPGNVLLWISFACSNAAILINTVTRELHLCCWNRCKHRRQASAYGDGTYATLRAGD